MKLSDSRYFLTLNLYKSKFIFDCKDQSIKNSKGWNRNLGNPVLSEAVYFINLPRSLNGLSISNAFTIGWGLAAYIIAETAPIERPQRVISVIPSFKARWFTTFAISFD